MIHFFGSPNATIFAVQSSQTLTAQTITKLSWLFGDLPMLDQTEVRGLFIGPRAAMVTPWSTNAVEITQNMGIETIIRIEQFDAETSPTPFDPMLFQQYAILQQDMFTVAIQPESILYIDNIAAYNAQEGLSLNNEEVAYLEALALKLNRKLTDSEVFGFSQVNSEHCRHKIFNGTFIIDGKTQDRTLFRMIKDTAQAAPQNIVSAYKDNVAFIKGPKAVQFAPKTADKADFYQEKDFESVISLKAETHNFPTTVEPFNGAATGSGGEIRDRLAGGQGSLPLAGTAVYMTPYARLSQNHSDPNRTWENAMPAREWLYQTPIDLLIKASNGASDFGNKFGQPLINGSIFTFEHQENQKKWAFDKVIMLAGGVGYGKSNQSKKQKPKKGEKIVLLGGDNYRIGMGGAAVSSANTGVFNSGIELNAIQRSNPEMQKRVANAIRALVENDENPIVSIHDHGAGGHLNCFSELIEETGGTIFINKLPVGDQTLSSKEIIGNESQERMGLIIADENISLLKTISERERAPFYEVGEVNDTHRFTMLNTDKTNEKPIDLALDEMFGSSPKTIIQDNTHINKHTAVLYEKGLLNNYLSAVLRLEAVACKDWLTNKVDRCVGGKVAKQQCAGPLQLPLNNVGVMALDYKGKNGIATAMGHAPAAALINAKAGSRLAIAEALTNIIWAPLENGLASVALSANWMWPCKNDGEDARLYAAVEAVSDMAIALGIAIPTGKDSLSMKQKYPKDEVLSPGTVIISAVGHCNAIDKIVEPVFQYTDNEEYNDIYYIDMSNSAFSLGGSALAQVLSQLGNDCPDIENVEQFKQNFNAIQQAIQQELIIAGHDISTGGLITTLLEMCFAEKGIAAKINVTALSENDIIKIIFAENPGIVFQAKKQIEKHFEALNIPYLKIGKVVKSDYLEIVNTAEKFTFNIESLRDEWFETSYLLDMKQTKNNKAKERFENFTKQALNYKFPEHFTGKLPQINQKGRIKAAIIREKGSNSEREMAHAMFLAGFDVKDIHMTDLISGRETLEDIQFIGAVGGFSNSDVLGSAKGWAGAFKYNEKAKTALDNFFARKDTLSVGICNGCQLFMELEVIYPEHKIHGKLKHNDSQKHESGFTSVTIAKNNSVMLKSLEGSTLGVWISHGEGKFYLPEAEENYHICAKYAYESYPANPNGSDYNTAMLSSADGRHLVMMPHIERSIFQWNWANYPKNRKDAVSPWLEAFTNAFNWLNDKK
jgi:phosphoribosylformylglycinamidine synthase